MLVLEALADELEPVRREELRQLTFSEQPRVRGIPHGLELVEHGGRSRIVGRELVDDEHVPSGPRHPRELGNHALGLRDVMERAMRSGEVEGGVRERERSAISLDELGVREASGSRELEQLWNRVEAHDLVHERRKREGQRPGARADVESSLVAARLHEVAHLLGEPRRTGGLTCGYALRRAGEAVSVAGLSS